MIHRLEVALLMYAVFFLQRIEAFGTSVGMIVLIALFVVTIFRMLVFNVPISSNFNALSTYPLFVFAFLYGGLFGLGSYSPSDLVPFVAAAIVWILFEINRDWRIEYFLDSRLLLSILGVLGYYLVVDTVTVLSESSGALKKTFEFSNPNYTGFLLNLLTWIWLLDSRRKGPVSAVFIVCATVAVAMTLSKSAYVVHLMLVLIYLRHNFILATIVFGVLTLAITPYLAQEGGYLDLMLSFFDEDLGDAVGHRAGLIGSAIDMAADNPFFGVGYGNFVELASKNYGAPLVVKTHNIILTLMAETGAIGFLIWLLSQIMLFSELNRIKLRVLWIGVAVFYLFALSHASGEQLSQFPLILGLIALLGKNAKVDRVC